MTASPPDPGAAAKVAFEDVVKDFGGARALDGVSLRIPPGAFTAVIGASGSGKSTLLRLVNRLIEPSSGVVRLDGADVRGRPAHELRRAIGFMPQGSGLFPHRTAAQNAGEALRLAGWAPERIAARVEELFELVRMPLSEFGDRRPAALSGGQRQRVAFARALAAEPSVMLLDEPFSALDPETRLGLQDDLRAAHDRLGLTTVMVTHDMAEAITLADEIVVMRGGRIVQTGSPEALAAAPVDDGVRGLLETPARQARAIAAVIGGGT